jgi:hypothetical protein
MKQICTLLIALLILSISSQAQFKGKILGTLVDSTKKYPVGEAAVSLLNMKDTSAAGFTQASDNGFFEITNLDTGTFRLIIAVKGLAEQYQNFKITPDALTKDLGKIIIKTVGDAGEIVVTSQAPIIIKDDTVSFKADAFKTKPNATVEDLLKKLPGVEVNKDGTVKAMGETVQKVYVDGKEFFGNDPKLATKNLRSDMVDRVELFDDMSDQAKFSKVDDGSRSKAINIKLKKDKKKGLFGKLTFGGGTNDRYDNSGNLNYFKGDTKVSYIGQLNNVNKQGFSLQDVMGLSGSGMGMGGRGGGGGRGNDDFGGGGGGMMGGATMISSRGGGSNGFFGVNGASSGISKSVASGANYVGKWGRKLDVSLNYFFNDANTFNNTNRFTQTFFPNDSITNATNFSNSNNGNGNHRINGRFEWAIDSVNSLLFVPNIVFQNGDGLGIDSTNTIGIKNNNSYLVNKSFTNSSNDNNALRANNSLLYRRKFKRPGRTLQLGAQYNINNSDRENTYLSPFTTFKPDGTPLFNFNQNQESENINTGKNFVANASYTEPIGKNLLLEINASHNENKTNADRETIDLVSGAIIPALTNDFENTYNFNRLGANVRKQTKKYNYQLGMGVQYANLISNNRTLNTKLTQNFINLFPTARLNFTLKKNRNLRFDYRGRTNAPSINQLQNVPDVSNPLNVSIGNPDLDQEFTHNLNVNYNKFNMFTFKFVGVFANFGLTQNKIVNSVDFFNPGTNNGRQITKPINMDGAMNGTLFLAYGSPLKKILKGLNTNISSGVVYNRDISKLFGNTNTTNFYILTQVIGLNYNFKESLDLGINTTLTYNIFKNKLQPVNNTNFLNQTYSLDATYTFKNGFSISSDVDYYNQGGVGNGFDRTFALWNASIAYPLFKNKKGEIRLYVYDILNQNNSVNRSTANNAIIDTRNLVLNRYGMLSFTYNFSRFGGKPSPNMMPKQFRRGMKDIRIN